MPVSSSMLVIDLPLFHARVDRLGDRARAMVERRERLDRDVDALLRVWRGPAAARFAEEYAAWRAAATSLTEELGGTVERLRSTGRDVGVCETGVADAQVRLASRLG